MPFKTFLKIAISLALLGYLFTLQDFSSSLGLLGKTHWTWLVFLFALSIVSQVLGTLRWQLLAQPLGFHLSFKDYFKYYMTSNFLTLFMPSSIGGDIGRLYALAKRCEKPKRLAALTLIADRLSGLIALLILTCIALFLPTTSEISTTLRNTVAAASGGVLLITVMLWTIPIRFLTRLFSSGVILQALTDYRKSQLVASSLLIAFLTHAIMIYIHLGIAQALGLKIAWNDLVWIYGLVGLATVLPVSFNGIGIREGGYVLLLGSIGILPEAAMSFALYWFALFLVIALLGGLPLLWSNSGPNSTSAPSDSALPLRE